MDERTCSGQANVQQGMILRQNLFQKRVELVLSLATSRRLAIHPEQEMQIHYMRLNEQTWLI